MSSSKALRTVSPPKPESNTPMMGRRVNEIRPLRFFRKIFDATRKLRTLYSYEKCHLKRGRVPHRAGPACGQVREQDSECRVPRVATAICLPGWPWGRLRSSYAT